MTVKFSRPQLLLAGTALVIVFVCISRFDFIFNSKQTTGTVIRVRTSGRGHYNSPLVLFETESSQITFSGEDNTFYELQEKVPVIYKVNDPTDAYIYTFVSFWLSPLLYCLFPIIILTALIFSFISSGDYIQAELSGKLSIKLMRDPENVRREMLEKSDKESIRKRALEGMKRRQIGQR
jgi:hypothetical protein